MGDTDDRGPAVYVVVAAYNEQSAIGSVIDDLSRHLPANQIIVVNDASHDDTAAVARSKGAVVLNHMINRGQGAALATGIAAALRRNAAVVVTFDADSQHSADDLPAMIAPILAGEADVVLGSRFLRGLPEHIPTIRLWTLRFAIVFTRLFTHIKVTDTHNGFRAMSAAAARAIAIRQDRMAHASEILDQIVRKKLRYVERPVTVRYSEYSLGKGQRNRDAVRVLFRIIMDKVMN